MFQVKIDKDAISITLCLPEFKTLEDAAISSLILQFSYYLNANYILCSMLLSSLSENGQRCKIHCEITLCLPEF